MLLRPNVDSIPRFQRCIGGADADQKFPEPAPGAALGNVNGGDQARMQLEGFVAGRCRLIHSVCLLPLGVGDLVRQALIGMAATREVRTPPCAERLLAPFPAQSNAATSSRWEYHFFQRSGLSTRSPSRAS